MTHRPWLAIPAPGWHHRWGAISPLGRRQRNDVERVARLSSRELAAAANSLQHTQTRLHYHHLLMLLPERSEQLFSDSASPPRPPQLLPLHYPSQNQTLPALRPRPCHPPVAATVGMELAAVERLEVFLPCWLVKLVLERVGAACRFVIAACWGSKPSATPLVINQEDVACPLDKKNISM